MKLPKRIIYDAKIYNINFIANHLTTIIPFNQRDNIKFSVEYVDHIKHYCVQIGEDSPDRIYSYISENGITFCFL